MTALGQALSSALLHFVWQGTVVAIALWIALFLLRRRGANARYLACCVALAILISAPVVTGVLVYRAPSAANASAGAAEAVSHSTLPAVPASASFDWLAAVQPWALPVWSFGVLLFSIRLVWSCREIAVLRRRGNAPDETLRETLSRIAARLRLSRPVRLLVAENGESPSVIGWLRPVVLLPSATLLQLTPEQLEAVLAHELAHIRRHDYVVNLVQIVAETLLFYHPAVWWTSARMRQERELCCDDLAVACCGDRICYARALTRLERLRVSPPALAMGSNGGSMLHRIQRLLGAGATDYAPSKLPGILALAVGVACLAVSTHHARAQQEEKKIAVAYTVNSPWIEPGSPNDGPGVKVDLQGATIAHRTGVEYPGAAWEQHIEGSVLVQVTTDSSGAVNDARVLAGPAELRKAVLESVLQWQFAPGSAGTARNVSISFQHVEGANPAEGQVKRFVILDDGGAQEQIAKLQKQIAEFKQANQGSLAQSASPSQEDKAKLEQYELLLHRLNEFKEQAARNNELQNGNAGPRTFILAEPGADFAGHRLERVLIRGLSADRQQQLGKLLPVHIGDILTTQSIEDLTKVVAEFDEHLEANLGITETGGVSVRIFARGSGQ